MGLFTDSLFTDSLFTDSLFADNLFTDNLTTENTFTHNLPTDKTNFRDFFHITSIIPLFPPVTNKRIRNTHSDERSVLIRRDHYPRRSTVMK